MPRYFLEISYNGTHYSGWQVQKNAVTVQEKINTALSDFIGSPVETLGCGRTDAGVHASQFFLHFDTAHEIADKKNFVHSLNGMLPYDISLLDLYNVSENAHARFDATSRTYHYFICHGKNVFMASYAMPVFKPLQIELLRECCRLLLSHTEFDCFCKSNSQNQTMQCTITRAEWTTQNNNYIFEITANRFLRGMVRAIVGTMLNVSTGKITVSDFQNILNSKDRRLAGASVPAQALYLTHISYPYLNIDRPVIFPFSINS